MKAGLLGVRLGGSKNPQKLTYKIRITLRTGRSFIYIIEKLKQHWSQRIKFPKLTHSYIKWKAFESLKTFLSGGMRTGNMTFRHTEMSLRWKFSDLWTMLCCFGTMSPQAPRGGAPVRHFENVCFSPGGSVGLVFCRFKEIRLDTTH